MTNDEYVEQMNLIVTTIQLLSTLPVEELLATVHQSETLGPILEPTAYARGGYKRLYEQRRVLEAVSNLVKTYAEIQRENAPAAAS